MDDTRQKINLKNIIEKLKLDIIVNTTKMPDITVADLNRPGLELTGYFDYFAYDRVQILGRTEISYLEGLP